MQEAVVEIHSLAKKYDAEEKAAVDSISFQVHRNEIVGLLGPNGAGKTTTINMMLGILEPTSGSISILHKPLTRYNKEVMSKVNFAAVYAQVPGNLTVEQNLTIFGLLYGVSPLSETVEAVIEEFELGPLRAKKVGVLSSGEQTRVSLTKALLNKPQLLLLDEPTASLDPHTSHIIREKIQTYAQQEHAGILWTSHNMHEVETVCNRVLFLSKGKLLLEGNPRTLPHEHGKKNLEELFITVAREPLSLELE